MTTPAAALRQPSSSAPFHGHTPPTRMAMPSMRTYEVVSKRADGTLHIGQHKAPALPLFESAFAAFGHGTLIQTTQGDVAIEDLQPGEMVHTSSGDPAEVLWIGSANFVPADVGRRTSLTRIMADTFGQARPASFLTVGPSARILQTPAHLRGETHGKAMFTPAQDFVDWMNVIEVTPPTQVRLFHICLSRHAAINVGGLEMETFHPGSAAVRSVSHAMRDLFLSMFPHISHVSDFGPLAHPRAPDNDVDQLI